MIVMKIISRLSWSNHRQKLVSKINVFTQHLATLVCLCNQMTFKVIMKDSGTGSRNQGSALWYFIIH